MNLKKIKEIVMLVSSIGLIYFCFKIRVNFSYTEKASNYGKLKDIKLEIDSSTRIKTKK